jgi:hypothetical protein
MIDMAVEATDMVAEMIAEVVTVVEVMVVEVEDTVTPEAVAEDLEVAWEESNGILAAFQSSKRIFTLNILMFLPDLIVKQTNGDANTQSQWWVAEFLNHAQLLKKPPCLNMF